MLKCVLGWCLPITYQKLESPSPDGPVCCVSYVHPNYDDNDDDCDEDDESPSPDGPVNCVSYIQMMMMVMN